MIDVMPGQIITIDGGDGTGKQTQAKILFDRLAKDGYNVKTMSFPRYDQKWGKLIREHLDGKHGGLKDINPYYFGSFYAFDRHEVKDGIRAHRDSGGIWVFDRWREANYLHQAAKFAIWKSQDEAIDFFRSFETVQLDIPESNLVFYMNLDPKYSAKAMTDQGRTLDIHEANLEYQVKVWDLGMRVGPELGWKMIPCLTEDNKQRRTVEELSSDIYFMTKHHLEPYIQK